MRQLRDAQGQIGEDTGPLRQADDDHHPDQQPERAPIDGLDRLLLLQDPDQDDRGRTEQRDLRPMGPFERDRTKRPEEHDDGDGCHGLP
jgi:hypothetical protein